MALNKMINKMAWFSSLESGFKSINDTFCTFLKTFLINIYNIFRYRLLQIVYSEVKYLKENVNYIRSDID